MADLILALGIVAGLVLGVLADYLMLLHGWKPLLAVTTFTGVIAFTWLATDDTRPINAVAMVLAFSSTRYLARPLLKRCLGVS